MVATVSAFRLHTLIPLAIVTMVPRLVRIERIVTRTTGREGKPGREAARGVVAAEVIGEVVVTVAGPPGITVLLPDPTTGQPRVIHRWRFHIWPRFDDLRRLW